MKTHIPAENDYFVGLQLPDEPIEAAKELFAAGGGESIHQPAWPVPDDDQIEAAIERENAICKQKER